MSNDASKSPVRQRPTADGRPAERQAAWGNDNAPWPPGRDALQRLVERRIAEKRRAARRKRAGCAKTASPG